MHVYLEWKRQEPSSLTSLDHSARITFSCMAYAPRLNRGAPKWPDSPLRLSISSGRQRKLHPRTAPTPFSISSLRSSGGGCLLSLTSTRVLSHSDARARFEHLHISRQGCCCGVTGTLSYSSILQVLPARQRDHWILRSGHIHRTPPCLHTDTPETICNTGYGMAIPSQREWLQQCYQVDDWSDCNGSVHIINLMWLEHYSCATFWNHSLALLPYPFRNYICVQSDVMLYKWIQLVGRHACAYCAMIGAPSQTLTKNDFPHAAMVTSCHYGHYYWLLQYGVH